ncbi:MAG: cyclic beta 1-2 glucan synthetase, partial [Acidimicrobiaceae bacterium]|nr:cyclic beta 1-2 glucan synthetase [Acidimicrobiaceae bacterium]
HMDGRVDSDNATQFIASYQTVEPLRLGELCTFQIMLQLALLETLRYIGVRIARRREERDAAIPWADRMLAAAEREPKQIIRVLAEFADADMPLTAPFVEEFYSRLQAQGSQMAFVQTWVEHKLLEQGVTATQLSAVASQKAAANQISIANSIGSLRFITSMDWSTYVESLSAVEKILREDPPGIHARQDFPTRDRYRHAIEDVAKGSPLSELEVAREAIVLAQSAATRMGINDRTAHVGYYLIDRGRCMLERSVDCRLSWKTLSRRANRHHRLFLYLTPILLFTSLATSLMIFHIGVEGLASWRYWFFGVTGAIGFSSLAVSLVNQMVPLFLPPRTLPRLDFSGGIPSGQRTMVIVPTMLSTSQEIDDLLEALEIRYLGNRDPNLFFALLTDFRDSPEQTLPEDDVLLSRAVKGVLSLNETYREDRACIFYLFHRPRVWNAIEQTWMGYERKRGKLEQFNAFLRGDGNTSFSELVGDLTILASIKYVITLDTDTQLPRDTARPLIGNIAHPLNHAVYDAGKGRIVEGYAILQPRASNSLTSVGRSLFAELFAGESGIDPYTREVSDVYQDIFGEGSYIGKGIYDVDAFRQAVDGHFPENLILSHDLLESGYARSALVTDVEFIEELPASYTMEASRRHRWIRGDWQLAGWLLPMVPGPPGLSGPRLKRQPNPLNALSLWKIFDNLRRSLVPPSLLAFLAGGWLFGPGPTYFWTLLVVGVLFLPNCLGAVIELIRKPVERHWMLHLSMTGKSAGRLVVLALMTLVFLPYDTLICLDAILSSGVRMLFTRRGLMLWHMQSYTSRNARHTLSEFFKEMWIGPLLAFTLTFLLKDRLEELLFCSPVLISWLVSPIFGWWISRPLPSPRTDLTLEQQVFIRSAARRTWRFFADFISPEDNWLPPDNFQKYPSPAIARRTSPTNIGMSLLAHLAAYDFGYISAEEFLLRSQNILSAMEKLERYRGHFYNWYDTRTLEPLRPQYVSTVDSGNLAGSLLTFQAGLAELKNQPVLSLTAFQGLHDTLRVLSELVPVSVAPDLSDKIKHLLSVLNASSPEGVTQTLAGADLLLSEVDRVSGRLVTWLPADIDIDGEIYYWAQAFDHQSNSLREDLRGLVPDLKQFNRIPTLLEISQEKSTDIKKQSSPAMERLRLIDNLVDRCQKLSVMDFEFLYDTSSNLLSIGYDVGERRRDPSCYDLLASEARLASFLLIAEGQVPQKHWFSLGRLLTSYGGRMCLISWSGSMFEYLMPLLMMASYENTLLDQTCKAAVSRQIEYGQQRAVPWGMSESCYNFVDIHQVYQYRAFGVPGLGFKRGLGDDLVIAPYASALALMVMPREACRNLQAMAANGFLGSYGYYEAVDYTPSRVPRGKNYSIVQTFMAHHQGMSLLAFEHILLDRPMQRRFMSLPMVRATELLLQERLPKKVAIVHPHDAEVRAVAHPPDLEQGEIRRVFTDPNTPVPEVHLLSNGRYHVMVNNAGGGYSRRQDLAVTRWREDATSDCCGTFIYLRDLDTGFYWSTAYQPTLRKAAHYEAIFVQARAEY